LSAVDLHIVNLEQSSPESAARPRNISSGDQSVIRPESLKVDRKYWRVGRNSNVGVPVTDRIFYPIHANEDFITVQIIQRPVQLGYFLNKCCFGEEVGGICVPLREFGSEKF
jgi:hypothetical protein